MAWKKTRENARENVHAILRWEAGRTRKSSLPKIVIPQARGGGVGGNARVRLIGFPTHSVLWKVVSKLEIIFM